jgi:hypothetical protein
MSRRNPLKAILTYGTQADRHRVAVIARLRGLSVSEYLMKVIRDDYAAVYGDADPETVDAQQQRSKT